ncbi:MAG: UPF0179 family protein [Candidatus Marsarchaeota archaeon]|nr:UPF0179 family protein [Candidatus Marsarchaeota archaeon]
MSDNRSNPEGKSSGRSTQQKKAQITLVPEAIARLGYAFTFVRDPGPECRVCPVKAPCLDNLVEGDTYSVKEVKGGDHWCALAGSQARVVQVEKTELTVTMEKQKVMLGAIVNYDTIACDWVFCKNYRYCVFNGVKRGSKVKLLERGKQVDCPRGFKLLMLKVRP